ncbi:acetyl-CoA C-acetyltransferase [Natranaerobius thermophilus]|uniref:Acetyl-CoA acetyltransferase n=1 Tax=Natranaerobius thermophilus (strain ATCC BAA-1301 / DSM 18059 / JW/NM-WN-LF) TaxID=457570 RepID=B2A666_NATTJ|nr:acetyl-CoA C-acetyltransferase [Natranaerobius thermophilus]ACB85479.1 acetyl-CoA acetyltransferase [Natranaerobius thermophilus JW/NM-WN-LF]
MEKIVIASGVRTPIGTYGGSLKDFPAHKLGEKVIKEAVNRASIAPEDVDEVIMGNVLQAGQGMNPSRQASLGAGIPKETPALTINKVCGSGLKALILGAQAIKDGDSEVVVVGGMENMSQAPYYLSKARFGYGMGHGKVEDAMIKDGLWCSITDQHMGNTAEAIAEHYNITREEQDEFSVDSQNKAEKAISEGWFQEEILPIEIPQKKKDPIIFDTDEHPKPGTTLDKLAKMKPAFQKEGTVTAANASGINDGAAAMVITTESKAKELGLEPLGVLDGYASAGCEPEHMGIGPVPATRKVLDKTGLSVDDLDLIEANEAFAVQSVAVMKELGLDEERVNIGGGAVSLGHPIGASGARILITLLYHMKRTDKKRGLATLCVGGGMGVSTIVSR